MTSARQILPGRTYVISRRTAQRQFLLRPDDITNNDFSYCLAEAADRFGISLIGWLAMSNHYHAVVHDNFGRLPSFLEHFHRSVAKTFNARWRRHENFWAATQTSVVYLPTSESTIAQLVYVLANPVSALLVERVTDWPGASSRWHFDGRVTVHRRPRHFFSDRGTMPARVELRVALPGQLGIELPVLYRQVVAALTSRESVVRERRQRERRTLVGRKAVLRQSAFDSPSTIRLASPLRPTVAGERRIQLEWLRERRAFLQAYADALSKFKLGDRDAIFPPGTWKMKRELRVVCADELQLAA